MKYKIVSVTSGKAEVQPRGKEDFEVENLETLEGRPNWITVIGFKRSLREKVSFHESESKAKRWLLNHIRDLPYRSRREDGELSMALVARQTAEYKEVDLPPDAERIFYCEDCRRFLLDGPERTACRLAGHSMLGENGAELHRAGKEMFFRAGEFTGRLVQNTSTKVVHALAIDEVYCSAECGDFSEEIDLDGARLCEQCRRKIVK